MKTTKAKSGAQAGRPALTPEARENQMISYAVDLAEKQLLEGTASSAVIVHYLKLADQKYKLMIQKLEEENKLLRAKTEDIQSSRESREMYEKALLAMREYSGHDEPDDFI